MQPYYIDILFALITLVLVVTGWRRGFVRMAGGLMSLAISIAAGIWGVTWIQDTLGIPLASTIVGLLVTFLVISIIVSAILNLVVTLLDLARRLITMIPGLGLLHRLAGAAVGVVEAAVLALGASYFVLYVVAAGDMRTLLLSTQVLTYGVRVLAVLHI